ncbi:hypothetical protein ACFSTC_29295 [Nonomuraea ferruginea]
MRDAMAAEWVKLRSIRSTWLCLAAGVVVSVLGAITLGGAAAMESEHVQATEPVVSVILFSQYAAIALAVLAVTTEYASGTIRPTLQAVPVRGRMLAAKALVVAPVLFAAGVLTGAAAALATYLVLLAPVFRSAPALAPAETAADLLRLGVFHALVGVLAVGGERGAARLGGVARGAVHGDARAAAAAGDDGRPRRGGGVAAAADVRRDGVPGKHRQPHRRAAPLPAGRGPGLARRLDRAGRGRGLRGAAPARRPRLRSRGRHAAQARRGADRGGHRGSRAAAPRAGLARPRPLGPAAGGAGTRPAAGPARVRRRGRRGGHRLSRGPRGHRPGLTAT